MTATPRGTAVMVPNSNGSFFSGASQIEVGGTVDADSEVNAAVVAIPATPNRLLTFKFILTAMFDDAQCGVNEYNGVGQVSEDGNLQNLQWTRMTGGQILADAEAELDFTGNNLEIDVANEDLARELSFQLFVTWLSLPVPYNIPGV